MIEFKIKSHANQEFSTILNGRRVTLRLWYSTFSDRWSMDVSVDGEPVLTGKRVSPGVDMLEMFDFKIGAIFALSEKGDSADRDALPEGRVKLYHANEDEISAAVAS